MKRENSIVIVLLALILISPSICRAQSAVDSILCAQQIERMILRAKTYNGTPYEKNSQPPHSFDCSGFIYQLYTESGMDVERLSSRQLSEKGTAIEFNDIKKGDLVFFTNSDGVVNHVGMAITDCADGNFQFIHANNTAKCVSINEFKTYFLRRVFWGARRISICP